MAVSQIVEADLFYAGAGGIFCEARGQCLLCCSGKNAIRRIEKRFEICFDFLHHVLRHRDRSDAGLCFWRSGVFQLPVVRLCDVYFVVLKIQIRRRQCKEFSEPHSGREQDREEKFVVFLLYGVNEFIEFIDLPKVYMRDSFSHTACDLNRVLRQAIKADGMIENRGKAYADIPERVRRERPLAVNRFCLHDLILPIADRGDCDLIDGNVAEVRKDVSADHALLAVDCIRFPARAEVVEVKLAEAGHRHVRGLSSGPAKLFLECFGVVLGCESALCLADGLSCPVSIAKLDKPGLALFVFVGWHNNTSIEVFP